MNAPRHPDHPHASGRPPYVGVAAASEAGPEVLALAEELGRALGEAGAAVVCGGGGGAMTAVCRGAADAGGLTIGLLAEEHRAGAPDALTVALPTGLGQGRNLLLVRASDALVAVGGGFGTLSEIALALRLGVPVVGLRTWALGLDGRSVDAYPVATTGSEAARLALEAACRRAGHRPDPERAAEARSP